MLAPVFINITPETTDFNGNTTKHPTTTEPARDYQQKVFYKFIENNPQSSLHQDETVTINSNGRIFDLRYNKKMYGTDPPTELLVDLLSYNYTPVSVMSTNKAYLESLAKIENGLAGRKSNKRKSIRRKSNKRKSIRRKSIRRKS